MCRLSNILWNNQRITEEIKKKKKFGKNENKRKMIQNLWDAGKEALGGKFITIWICLKKQEKSQVNNLILHLKELEKDKQK